MAVTVTITRQGLRAMEATVIATADGDTTATIPHGLGVAPNMVALRPASDVFYTSRWFITSVDATNVVLTKAAAVGSGAGPIQLVAQIQAYHSMVQ